jgi:hypothetical protein
MIIRAELETLPDGHRHHCSALGMKAIGDTPVIALCRKLLKGAPGTVTASPSDAMEVYRGKTLALYVKSIGEAASLKPNGSIFSRDVKW